MSGFKPPAQEGALTTDQEGVVDSILALDDNTFAKFDATGKVLVNAGIVQVGPEISVDANCTFTKKTKVKAGSLSIGENITLKDSGSALIIEDFLNRRFTFAQNQVPTTGGFNPTFVSRVEPETIETPQGSDIETQVVSSVSFTSINIDDFIINEFTIRGTTSTTGLRLIIRENDINGRVILRTTEDNPFNNGDGFTLNATGDTTIILDAALAGFDGDVVFVTIEVAAGTFGIKGDTIVFGGQPSAFVPFFSIRQQEFRFQLLADGGGFVKILTGDVAITPGTAAVVGTGTLFTTELIVGEAVQIREENFSVLSITDDTNFTLSDNHVAGAGVGIGGGLNAIVYIEDDLFSVGTFNGTTHLSVDKQGNTIVGKNLIVQGTTTTIDSETVNVVDNHLYLNKDYTTAVSQTGGLVVNFLPTATADTITAVGFVSGVASTSNPTVTTTGASVFATRELIQISGSTSNDGIYEVSVHTANVLEIRGIGLIATSEDFVQNQFVAEAGLGTITKINVSVMRTGINGIWETANGSISPLVFSDLLDAGTTALLQNNRIPQFDQPSNSFFNSAMKETPSKITSSKPIKVPGNSLDVGADLVINSLGSDLGTKTLSSGKIAAFADVTFIDSGSGLTRILRGDAVFDETLQATDTTVTAAAQHQFTMEFDERTLIGEIFIKAAVAVNSVGITVRLTSQAGPIIFEDPESDFLGEAGTGTDITDTVGETSIFLGPITAFANQTLFVTIEVAAGTVQLKGDAGGVPFHKVRKRNIFKDNIPTIERGTQKLTGLVDVTGGLNTVVGTGTLFTTEIAVGDTIFITSDPYDVVTITDNLNLTVSPNIIIGETQTSIYEMPDVIWKVDDELKDYVIVDKSGSVSISGGRVPRADPTFLFVNSRSGTSSALISAGDNTERFRIGWRNQTFNPIETNVVTAEVSANTDGTIQYIPRSTFNAGHDWYTGNPTPTIKMNMPVSGELGLGFATAPVASSLFEMRSTTQGFLEPRLTTVERDSIGTPATGLQIYNTTTNFLNYFDGTVWQEIDIAAGAGDVVGPASAVNNAIVRWDGTTGKLIQDSVIKIGDTGTLNNVSGDFRIDSFTGGRFTFNANGFLAGADLVNQVEMGHGGVNGFINNIGLGNLDFRHEGATVATLTDAAQFGVNSTPVASATLQADSTTRGFLEPRMTEAQRDLIATPATGLQIFNTNSNKPNYFNGTVWKETVAAVGSFTEGSIVFTDTGGDPTQDNANFFWDNTNDRLGIGTNVPSVSTKLQIDSTTSGFLGPRMTEVQRDAIVTPAAGLQIFNTTTNEPNYFDGTIWRTVIDTSPVDSVFGRVGAVVAATGDYTIGQLAGTTDQQGVVGNATGALDSTDKLRISNAGDNLSIGGGRAPFTGIELLRVASRAGTDSALIGIGDSNSRLRVGWRLEGTDPIPTNTVTAEVSASSQGFLQYIPRSNFNSGHDWFTGNPTPTVKMNMDVNGSLALGTGTTAARASAILEVSSTTKAMQLPRWTDAEEAVNIVGLGAADSGLFWFNTTISAFKGWEGATAIILG